jgi:hypothetical protein
MMRKGIVGIGLIMAIVLGGTFVNWTYQWSTSMKSRADHQCSDEANKLLIVPGAVFDEESYQHEPGKWQLFHRWVSCEELVSKKDK